jgi:hypothetical protein
MSNKLEQASGEIKLIERLRKQILTKIRQQPVSLTAKDPDTDKQPPQQTEATDK